MSVPASFDESNMYLNRPSDMTEEQCDPLSVLVTQMPDNTPVVYSCWKLTIEELAEVNRTGRIWLGICGHSMPPAFVSGIKPFGA